MVIRQSDPIACLRINPEFCFDADLYLAFHFDADPAFSNVDPNPHQINATPSFLVSLWF